MIAPIRGDHLEGKDLIRAVAMYRAEQVVAAPGDPPSIDANRLAAGVSHGHIVLVHVVLDFPHLNARAGARHTPRVRPDGVLGDVLEALEMVCPDAEGSEAT